MLDESLLIKNQTIAVALSGGKDSVCLLHLLLSSKEKTGIFVKAVNVEHGIRGAQSLDDTEFCKKLCADLGVDLKCYTVNVPEYAGKNGVSEETAARILRYECFDNALIGGFCDKIATAHHMADSVETILFNLFRGSAVKGVCGISKTANDGKIIRPLLSVSRAEIDSYTEKNNLPFVTDESNFDDNYSRNFIRNNLLPLIKQNFPFAEQNMFRFSSILREENEFLDKLARGLINGNEVIINADNKDENDVLFRRACLIVMKKSGFTADYEQSHLNALCELKNNQCGAAVCLKNGLKAIRTKTGVIFEKDTEESLPEIPFSLGTFIFGKYTLRIEKAERKNDGFLYFDLDKLPYSTVIRTKRDGDFITAFGGKTKKLKKYLNDKKIEARVSKTFPIIAKDNEVFAVCPVDIGEKIKTDDSTVNTVRIIVTQGENNA